MPMFHPLQGAHLQNSHANGPSHVAGANFQAFLKLDPRGSVDQVTTEFAARRFKEAEAAQPWPVISPLCKLCKKGSAYVLGYALGGAATIATVGGVGYLTYQGYGVAALAGLCGATALGAELTGTKPSLLLLFLARDIGNQAGKILLKHIEDSETRAQEKAALSHSTALEQSKAVFHDMALGLLHRFDHAKRTNNISDQLKLMHDEILQAKKNLPAAERLLRRLKLDNGEIEEILQPLNEMISRIEKDHCSLELGKNAANAALLTQWPAEKIAEVAIPRGLQEEVEQARAGKLGVRHKLKGYGWSVLEKTGYACAAASSLLFSGSYFVPSSHRTYGWPHSTENMLFATGVVGGVGGFALGRIAASSRRQNESALRENHLYVQEIEDRAELKLTSIYAGVARHLRDLNAHNHGAAEQMATELEKRLPAIEQQIADSRITKGDFSYILDPLRKEIQSVLHPAPAQRNVPYVSRPEEHPRPPRIQNLRAARAAQLDNNDNDAVPLFA